MLDYIEYMKIVARRQVSSYTFTLGRTVTEPFTLKIDQYDDAIFEKADGNIPMDKIAWHPSEVSERHPYLINQQAIARLKEETLTYNIARELDSMAEAIARYYDYYKDNDLKLVVYRLDNYNSNQNHDMVTLVRFEQRGSVLNSIKEHKLTGLTSRCLSEGTVSRETLEAWRYRVMDWRDIRELSPTFFETVLRGDSPE